jgi:TadE-like protein
MSRSQKTRLSALGRFRLPKVGNVSTGRSDQTQRDGAATSEAESGAAMIEFAMIAALFFGLLFAIIDFSIVIFDMHAANNGARATARFASTGQFGTKSDCPMVLTPDGLPDVSGPAGDPTTIANQEKIDNLKKIICTTKLQSRMDSSRIRVDVHFEDSTDIFVKKDNPAPGDTIVVCSMTQARSLTGFYGAILDSTVMQSKTRARLENNQGVSFTKLTPGGEAAFEGEQWTSCYRQLNPIDGWTNRTS